MKGENDFRFVEKVGSPKGEQFLIFPTVPDCLSLVLLLRNHAKK